MIQRRALDIAKPAPPNSGHNANDPIVDNARAPGLRPSGRNLLGLVLAMVAAAVPLPALAQEDFVGEVRRVASLDVCGDQLLLALATPSQIIGLSSRATNPRFSFLAAAATELDSTARGFEAIVAAAPDLVLVGPDTPEVTRERLLRLGYQTAEIDRVASVNDAIAQVRDIATRIGQSEAGERLAQTIVAARGPAQPVIFADTALALGTGSVAFTDGTLMADLLRIVGLNNVADEIARDDGRVQLEVLITAPPRYLIVPEPEDGLVLRADILTHPALEAVFPPAGRLEIAENLTVCGGPSIPEALRRLANELRRVGR